ncbi:MAG: hypothetical protein WC728_05290 [Elusimicrobiota bacterium]
MPTDSGLPRDGRSDGGADELLRGFEMEEEKAFSALESRLAQIETRILTQAEGLPAQFEARMSDLLRRLSDAKAEGDRRAEEFRQKLLSAGPVSEGEFRARLVMLEMEYSSRLRLAEEGLGLLSESVRASLESMRDGPRRLIEEVRGSLHLEVSPSRGRIAQELRVQADRLRELEKAAASTRALEEETRSLREKAGALEGRLQEAQAAGLEKETELQERRGEAAELKTLLDAERAARLKDGASATRESDELRMQAGRLKGRLDETATAWAQAKTEIEALELRSEALSEELKAFEATRDEALRAKAELEKLKAGAEESMSEARRALDESQASLAEARESVERLRGERDEARRLLDEARESLKDAALAREQAVSAQSALDASQATLAETQKSVEQMRGEQDEARRLLVGARKSLEEMALARDRALAARDQAKILIEELVEEKEARASAAAQAPQAPPPAPSDEEIRTLRLELEMRQGECAKLREESATLRFQADSLAERLKAAEASGRQLSEVEAEWLSKREQFEDLLSQQARELNALKLHAEQREREWADTTARLDLNRVQELFKLRAKIQQLKWAIEKARASPEVPQPPPAESL